MPEGYFPEFTHSIEVIAVDNDRADAWGRDARDVWGSSIAPWVRVPKSG